MRRSRRRSIYCDPADWARIGERAGDAGMTMSAFIMSCAQQDDETPESPAGGLHLTEDEQRDLYQMIRRLDRCSRALLEPGGGIGMSALEALEALYRAHGGRG